MIASLTLKHQTAQLKMFGPVSINRSNTITLSTLSTLSSGAL